MDEATRTLYFQRLEYAADYIAQCPKCGAGADIELADNNQWGAKCLQCGWIARWNPEDLCVEWLMKPFEELSQTRAAAVCWLIEQVYRRPGVVAPVDKRSLKLSPPDRSEHKRRAVKGA